MRVWIAAMAMGIMGCGGAGVPRAETVAVNGTAKIPNVAAPKNLVLVFRPADSAGHLTGFPLKGNGDFQGNIIPGRYAYYFTVADNISPIDSNLKFVPEKYREADLQRTVLVPRDGGRLDLNFE